MIGFDAIEKRLEITLAKTFITFTLNKLKKDWADHRIGENLEKKTTVFCWCTIN